VSKPILIVGGGPAGLAAASALSGIGQSAILV
jgi:2-polyprenyl-6-methoxyphenol hydroxylase-like FAD-dependent oxidoreductase